MNAFPLALALLFTVHPLVTHAAGDSLGSVKFSFQSADPDRVVEDTVANLKSVFQRYKPALGSGMSIVSPLRIGGTASHPTMQMKVKKCVLLLCRTVKVDASLQIREVNGNCRRNYTLLGDLSRSSEHLARNYDSLKVNICYEADRTQGQVRANAVAVRARSYEGGIVANEIVKMLKLQISPMVEALRQSLFANGARDAAVF
jgi:hypothetical protein